MSESFINKNNVASVVIKKPRITEKTTYLSEKSGYTFIVDSRSNKIQIKKAIKELYNVTPIKINVINSKSKTVFRKGKKGSTSKFKKAIVFLKKGDKIDLV